MIIAGVTSVFSRFSVFVIGVAIAAIASGDFVSGYELLDTTANVNTNTQLARHDALAPKAQGGNLRRLSPSSDRALKQQQSGSGDKGGTVVTVSSATLAQVIADFKSSVVKELAARNITGTFSDENFHEGRIRAAANKCWVKFLTKVYYFPPWARFKK